MGLVGISSFRVLIIHFLQYVIVIRDHQLRQFRHLEDVVEAQKSLLEFGPIHIATSMKPANSIKTNFINVKCFVFFNSQNAVDIITRNPRMDGSVHNRPVPKNTA